MNRGEKGIRLKPKRNIQFSVGWSSILMIFVVLCLTAFGILSYLTAGSDYKLSAKTAQNEQDYYAMLWQSEKKLQAIDAAVLQARSDAEHASVSGSCDGLADGGDYSKVPAVQTALKSSEPPADKCRACCAAFLQTRLSKQGVTFSNFSAGTLPVNAEFSMVGDRNRRMRVSLIIDPFAGKERCRVISREITASGQKQEGESALDLWPGN